MRHDEQRSFRFPVEEGKVREFLRATLPLLPFDRRPTDTFDLYPACAPLVFSRVADFHQPDGTSIAELIGCAPSILRHAGHSWQCTSPLRIGRSYGVVGWRVTEKAEKRARDGSPMQLVTAERLFFDEDGDIALTEHLTVAVLDKARQADKAPDRFPEGRAEAHGIATWNADWRTAAPGAVLADLTVPSLGITDIVRFAGAIGDFTPIHHDKAAARANGLPDIIAMGMLPCALAALVVERGFGNEAIASFAVRFRAPLFQGQNLRLRVVASDNGCEAAPVVAIEGTSLGSQILSATAVIRT